jgi:serine/threonine-protein kinase
VTPGKHDPLIGRQLGRCEIVSQLGRGAFGTVYLARHTLLDDERAVKVMHGEIAETEDFRDRFLAEAKVASKLRHANIVPVFDFGVDNDGTQFMVMGYVASTTLAARLAEDRPVPMGQTAVIANQVAAALDHAHSRQVVHRDVKPSNILLRDEDGVALLSDFGIAKVIGLSGPATKKTRSVVLGTFGYMSPEQWQGQPLDARSDIYSLAIVLFELLTGEVPYGHGAGAMQGHVSGPIPSPRRFNPYVPEAVDGVLKRGMAHDRDDRYEAAGDLAAELSQALGSSLKTLPLPPIEPERAPVVDPATELDRMRAAGDAEGVAEELCKLAREDAADGRYSSARLRYEEALVSYRRLGHIERVAATLLQIVRTLAAQHAPYPQLQAYGDEALSLWRQLGRLEPLGDGLLTLGRIAFESGEITEARRLSQQAVAVWGEGGNERRIASSLFNLALTAERQERILWASELLAQTWMRARASHDDQACARAASGLARLAFRGRQFESALLLWAEALNVEAVRGESKPVAAIVMRMSECAAGLKDHALTLRLAGAAYAMYKRLGDASGAEGIRTAPSLVTGSIPEKAVHQAWAECLSLDVPGIRGLAVKLSSGANQ